MLKKVFKKTTKYVVYLFAITGFIFVSVYIAIQMGWLNVRGSASQRDSYFNKKSDSIVTTPVNDDIKILCKINAIHKYAPVTSINIYKVLRNGSDMSIINRMIETASLRFKDNAMFQNDMFVCSNTSYDSRSAVSLPNTAYAWADSDEWALMKEVFARDQDVIRKAAHDAGVEPRILLGGVIGEQFRFFGNRRESFKQYFEPLKILASLSNTSYGIAGLKPKTLAQIEEHMKDPKSPFYLGSEMENFFKYDEGADIPAVRFNRITDVKDPYYSYLYAGLYMRQIQTQWANAGYDIKERPDILGTLYNLGFYYSVPKANPQSGGSIITVSEVPYNFGDLAYEFYYSGELSDIFPFGVK